MKRWFIVLIFDKYIEIYKIDPKNCKIKIFLYSGSWREFIAICKYQLNTRRASREIKSYNMADIAHGFYNVIL